MNFGSCSCLLVVGGNPVKKRVAATEVAPGGVIITNRESVGDRRCLAVCVCVCMLRYSRTGENKWLGCSDSRRRRSRREDSAAGAAAARCRKIVEASAGGSLTLSLPERCVAASSAARVAAASEQSPFPQFFHAGNSVPMQLLQCLP